MLDDFDIEQFAEDEEEPVTHALEDDGFDDEGDSPKKGGGLGRFLAIFMGIGIVLVVLVGAVYLMMKGRQADQNAAADAASQTQIAAEATSAYEEALFAQSATETAFQFAAQSQPTNTPAPVNTSTPVSQPTQDPRTATVQALLTQASVAQTQAANAQLTITPTPTALPNTGFLDDYGPTGMIFAAVMLIVVIFFSRKIRTQEN
jgi:hypothetical protein